MNCLQLSTELFALDSYYGPSPVAVTKIEVFDSDPVSFYFFVEEEPAPRRS